jgi:hypothetical protein
MPERNVELLERTMQFIKDHPEQHSQGWWFKKRDCGTAACFAGWAVTLKGYLPVFHVGDCRAETVVLPGYRREFDTPELAQELLGLTLRERETLFEASNTSEMLELMVKDLVNGDELKETFDYRKLAHQE